MPLAMPTWTSWASRGQAIEANDSSRYSKTDTKRSREPTCQAGSRLRVVLHPTTFTMFNINAVRWPESALLR